MVVGPRLRRRHKNHWAALAVAVIAGLGLLIGCSSGDGAIDPTPGATATPLPMADEVVQQRVSTVKLGAAPGRRPGDTPLDALEHVEVAAGRQLDYVRAYVAWDGEFPDQRHQTIAAGGRAIHLSITSWRMDGTPVGWSDIANARFGDALFAEIQDWIGALARFDGELLVTFHHEPEIAEDLGSAEDFVAAWRRLAGDLADRSPDTETIWVVTGGGMRDPSINDWYPGDDVVDRIGADVFNWYGCRGESEPWRTAQETLSPLIAFGAQHPTKPLVVAEIGTDEDDAEPGRKASWYAELLDLLSLAAFEQISMVAFFHNDHSDSTTCDWWLNSSTAAADAFSVLATSATFAGDQAAPAVVRCPSRLHIPGGSSDEALIDTDNDGIVDLAFGAENRFVGIGEQGADGHDQRAILRFPPLATTPTDGERVELRVRLGQQVTGLVGNVQVSLLADPLVEGLAAFDAPAQVLTSGFMTAASRGGYYTVDVTDMVTDSGPSAFRLEVPGSGLIDGVVSPYLIGLSEATNEADRPALIVRTC